MKSILEPFVHYIDLHLEQLIDRLITMGILDTKHIDIMTVQMERGHRARQLWNLLLRVPPGRFFGEVEPLLREVCPIVFKEQTAVRPRKPACLRCVMEHMLPLEEIADQLNRKHYLKLADYRDITSSRMCEIDKWWRIFESLRKLGGKSDAHGIIGAKLEEFEIPVPPDLKHILAAGVPCMCRPTSEEPSVIGIPPGHSRDFLCVQCAQGHGDGDSQSQSSAEEHLYVNITFGHSPEEQPEEVELRPRSCRNLRALRLKVNPFLEKLSESGELVTDKTMKNED
ncbi:hypothetical protein BaRGS_00018989 [Batillaria attramentaria]|uniref:Uncharacterized protein n=1 Tax=Batillaria attramentaria TaxID=370345 RepID=A0ABD0KSS4_9CAEN